MCYHYITWKHRNLKCWLDPPIFLQRLGDQGFNQKLNIFLETWRKWNGRGGGDFRALSFLGILSHQSYSSTHMFACGLAFWSIVLAKNVATWVRSSYLQFPLCIVSKHLLQSSGLVLKVFSRCAPRRFTEKALSSSKHLHESSHLVLKIHKVSSDKFYNLLYFYSNR